MDKTQPLCIVDTDTQLSRIYTVTVEMNVGSGNMGREKTCNGGFHNVGGLSHCVITPCD